MATTFSDSPVSAPASAPTVTPQLVIAPEESVSAPASDSYVPIDMSNLNTVQVTSSVPVPIQVISAADYSAEAAPLMLIVPSGTNVSIDTGSATATITIV